MVLWTHLPSRLWAWNSNLMKCVFLLPEKLIIRSCYNVTNAMTAKLCQAITYVKADFFSTKPLETKLKRYLIEMQIFYFNKMFLKMSSVQCLPFYFMHPHQHWWQHLINTLRPRQNGRHFPDDIFKWTFLNENVWISFDISLKFVPRGPINNIPTLVQVMAWRQPGDKPLSEPMMVRLPTHTTKWTIISRRHFQMDILQWKL